MVNLWRAMRQMVWSGACTLWSQ